MCKPTFLLIFLSIVNKNIIHSEKFRVSDCTFRKVQDIDLDMTQKLGGYNIFILAKMRIHESLGSRFTNF